MIHMWMLLYLFGSLGSSCNNTIAAFPSERECEKARLQIVAKLAVKKSACIEVTQAVMIPGPLPEDHDH